MEHAAILIEQLSYTYAQKPVLKNISLSIPYGKMFGILGPNGSGKSTLLHIVSGLFRLQDGKVTILGYDLKTQAQDIRELLGVTFQNPSLDKKLTVKENLMYHGYLYHLSGAELAGRIKEVCHQFDLTDYLTQTVEKLSGGFKRRVELAKVVLIQPKLLLLDEPTTGLDPAARIVVWNHLRALQKKGISIVFTTHLMDEADQCDALALFHQGKLVTTGTPMELKQTLNGQLIVVKTNHPDEVIAAIKTCWSGPMKVTDEDIRIQHHEPAELAGKILNLCKHHIQEITLRYPTLEDVFLHATGSTLRGSDV